MSRLVRCFLYRFLLVLLIPLLLIVWIADVIRCDAVPFEKACSFWFTEWTLAARMPNKEVSRERR
jgi:hypothetical protein